MCVRLESPLPHRYSSYDWKEEEEEEDAVDETDAAAFLEPCFR